MSGVNPLSQPRSSSFPISSPSFWDEATRVASPIRSAKREHSPQDEGASSSPPAEVVAKRPRHSAPATEVSYLPNRADVAQDDPHAYLANAEYAPNRFGDFGDYMRKKEIKIQTQNRDIALANVDLGLPQIFAGLSFYINGNTHPPMEELRKMILQRGGETRPVLRSKGMVNFIIAPVLTQMKFKQFQNYRVVREAWITESCKVGKLLDWSRWKLTVQGGWEEEGRKGLEGFFAGKTSQAVKEEVKEEAEDEKNEEQVTGHVAVSDAAAGPFTPSKTHAAATRSLLTPMRASSIPISPGRVRAETPGKEKMSAKIQKPEGAWEHYYSKESNEDAARLLKNQKWRLTNTAERGNEGGFIDGYYQNSRLHHLSTWKAELRVLVAAAQRQSEELSLSGPSNSTISPLSLSMSILPRAAPTDTTPGERIIFHVDFDCFFVSCGLATRPHLKGRPCVVCHSQAGRGASSTSEIASASYEARAKGVKNGMSLGRARALVGKDLQTIPYEFDTYKKYSLAFYTVLMGYADELQAVSVDEALIDVTSAVGAREAVPQEAIEDGNGLKSTVEMQKTRDAAVEIAEKIRDDVRKLTDGCEVSIGISHNILLAKLATRRAKPAGVFHLQTPDVPPFLAALDVEDFPSVGYSIKSKIEENFGTTTCGDLLEHSKGAFQKVLGPKTGEMVYGYLRGVDEKKLEPHKERKSISAEMNYGIRFQSQHQADNCVKDLAAEVAKRMKQVNVRGHLLTLKLLKRHPDAPIEPPKFLGHGWCETYNKSAPIQSTGGSATDDAMIMGNEAVKLLRGMRLDPAELRGVGIQITKLDGEAKAPEREAGQGTLIFSTKRSLTGGVKSEREGSSGASTRPSPRLESSTENTKPQAGFSPLIEAFAPPPSPQKSVKRPLPKLPTRKGPAPPPSSPPIPAAPPKSIAGPSRLNSSTASDGIDPEFLAALPPELRQEVQHDFARTKAMSRKSAPPPVGEGDCPSNAATTLPSAKPQGKHAAAHITKQLRPKLKTQMKTNAVAELPLYGAWAKAKDKEIMDLTGDNTGEMIGDHNVSEVIELGIDPSVFRELPADLQQEIVAEERGKARKRKILNLPADISRAQARERDRDVGRTASLSPTRSSRAGSAAPVNRLTVSRPAKPVLLKATSLSDVLETMTRWIDSRKGAGPAARDANKVKAYLVKCMAPEAGMGGPENAIEVLRWMRSLLEEIWGRGEVMEDTAGKEWWDTWDGFREQVNRISLERFGAGIRLET